MRHETGRTINVVHQIPLERKLTNQQTNSSTELRLIDLIYGVCFLLEFTARCNSCMSISIYIVEKGIDKYVKNIYLRTRLKLGHRIIWIIRDVHRRGPYVAFVMSVCCIPVCCIQLRFVLLWLLSVKV